MGRLAPRHQLIGRLVPSGNYVPTSLLPNLGPPPSA